MVFFVVINIHNIRHHNKSWHNPNTRFDSTLGWSPIANRSVIAFDDKKISSNSLGFRSAEVDQTKGHVLIVGDSVVWGYGVSDNETVSYYLQEYLDKKYKNLQALNLGVSGYGIDQYYLWLKKNISKTNPKLIIVVIQTGTDFDDTRQSVAYGKSKPFFKIDNNDELRNMNSRISKFSAVNLLSVSPWRMKFLTNFIEKFAYRESLDPTPAKLVIIRLLKEIDKLALKYNSRLLFVISPDKIDYQEETDNFRIFKDIFNNQPEYSFLNYFDIVRKKKIGIESLYIDPYHYSPYGNEHLARTIYEYLDSHRELE